MDNNKPRLFIYIPTYNRPQFIRQQLDLLVPQVLRRPDRVRLLVNDNCSPFGINDSLNSEYFGTNISFRKNSGNIGGNANIAIGYTFAHSDEFLWILGDDDHVSPGVVDLILNLISPEVDLIMASHSVKELQSRSIKFEDGWDSLSPGFTFVSASVYNMLSIRSYLETAFGLLNSSYPHYAVLIQKMANDQNLRTVVVPFSAFFGQHCIAIDGDYTLTTVGWYLLGSLMPEPWGKEFCWNRFVSGGYYFYRFREKHKLTFLQSRDFLKTFGIKFRTILVFSWLIENIRKISMIRKVFRSKFLLSLWHQFMTKVSGYLS